MTQGQTKNRGVEAGARNQSGEAEPRVNERNARPAEHARAARGPAEHWGGNERELPVTTRRRLWKRDALLTDKGI